MPLIGTAGHVDHGKSTLVMALSGRDPDRWAEEKRRGLTIDLGFAWADLGNGLEISFVDVPGHEKFLKNMLAGIEAVDVALLVVAADEGWMPQSEEHLAVLDLLEVSRGVVAITKTDLVDSDIVELAHLEVEDRLQGTSLEGASIVPVSATTDSGLGDLSRELVALTEDIEPASGPPRLWIDRSFSVAGTGTVVTGTLLEGSVEVGEHVEIYPTGVAARVRSLQSHEKEMSRAAPGSRVAIGLSGVSRQDTPRGHMIGPPGCWEPTTRFSAVLKKARYAEELTEKGAFHLHIGSGAHPLRIQRIQWPYAVMTTEHLIPARMGDRFIIRDSGRRLVVAGGQVLDPAPGSLNEALANAHRLGPESPPDERAGQLLEIRESDSVRRLSQHSGGGRPVQSVVIDSHAFTGTKLARLMGDVERLTSEEHSRHPLRRGLPLATIATTLGISNEVAEAVVARSKVVALSGPDVSRIDHEPTLDDNSSSRWDVARRRLRESLAVPTTSELDLSEETFHLLIRDSDLVRVSENLVYLPEQLVKIEELIRGLSQPFGVGDVKEALGLSRKYVVPILEWLDANQITVRKGETRSVRPQWRRSADEE